MKTEAEESRSKFTLMVIGRPSFFTGHWQRLQLLSVRLPRASHPRQTKSQSAHLSEKTSLAFIMPGLQSRSLVLVRSRHQLLNRIIFVGINLKHCYKCLYILLKIFNSLQ